MGKPFFTKKQKALMRERRKKKKQQQNPSDNKNDKKSSTAAAEVSPSSSLTEEPASLQVNTTTTEGSASKDNDSNIQSSSKRPREEHERKLHTKRVDGKILVGIPAELSTKDAKKFRKDARRQLRKDIIDEESSSITIEFVPEEEIGHAASKKRKKNFPSIKELLKEKEQQAKEQKEAEKLQKRMQSIPEELKTRYVALDCEMVGIGTDGKKSALARVSMVDWDGNVMLDTFVQVPTRVTDFRTHVSGVEPKHIKNKNTAMDVVKCRELVAKLLKDKILVGHALRNDLQALLLQHPKKDIRDTAKFRPFQRFANGKWRPRKLRDLVKENLKGKAGFQEASHDSVDDAKATMELFHLVQPQWEKEIAAKTK
jgi:RNA exonuclease 4